MDAQSYLEAIKLKLAGSPIVKERRDCTRAGIMGSRLFPSATDPEHYPDLSFFPHHIHLAEEKEVHPGRLLSTIAVVDLIARELAAMFGENEWPAV